jgi:hypothetical protein
MRYNPQRKNAHNAGHDMTRVLVIYYSQTGQLESVARAMLAPLVSSASVASATSAAAEDVEIVWQRIEPVTPFPFPWPFFSFLEVFPESALLVPPAIHEVTFDPDSDFDLIIIAYQVWFLSPSLPITAFMRSTAARVLKNKPVITVIGCRNMWLSAQEKMKMLLAEREARLIDNVVLVDQGPAWATFVTTPRWLWTGKRNGFWGVFPPAGIAAQEIASAARFGRALKAALPQIKAGAAPLTGPLLTGLKAVKVAPALIAGEKIGNRSFTIWGKLLRAAGAPGTLTRRILLMAYLVFLITIILTVLPIGAVVRALLHALFPARLDAEVSRLESPSGSSDHRMQQFLH